MQEKPMSEIRVYPGLIIDGDGSKVIFTLTPIIGETREDYEQRCHEVFKLAVSHVAPSSPTFEVADTSRYRKVGKYSYEIVTPGYESKEETVSERDTHFFGFARALLNEIFDEWEGNLSLGKDLYPQDNERVAQHIARRAYDLVYFLLDKAEYHSGSFDTGWGTPDEIRETISSLPDMDKWPE